MTIPYEIVGDETIGEGHEHEEEEPDKKPELLWPKSSHRRMALITGGIATASLVYWILIRLFNGYFGHPRATIIWVLFDIIGGIAVALAPLAAIFLLYFLIRLVVFGPKYEKPEKKEEPKKVEEPEGPERPEAEEALAPAAPPPPAPPTRRPAATPVRHPAPGPREDVFSRHERLMAETRELLGRADD